MHAIAKSLELRGYPHSPLGINPEHHWVEGVRQLMAWGNVPSRGHTTPLNLPASLLVSWRPPLKINRTVHEKIPNSAMAGGEHVLEQLLSSGSRKPRVFPQHSAA